MTKVCDGEGLVSGHEALRISQTCQCKPTLDASRRHLRFARRNTPKHHVYQTRDQPNILCPTWPLSKTIGKLTSRQTCWRNLVGLKATFVVKSKYTSNSLDGCHDDQQHFITVLYSALGIEFTETSMVGCGHVRRQLDTQVRLFTNIGIHIHPPRLDLHSRLRPLRTEALGQPAFFLLLSRLLPARLHLLGQGAEDELHERSRFDTETCNTIQ